MIRRWSICRTYGQRAGIGPGALIQVKADTASAAYAGGQ
jgi:hypothetical protein